jgi:hypothetical protein
MVATTVIGDIALVTLVSSLLSVLARRADGGSLLYGAVQLMTHRS